MEHQPSTGSPSVEHAFAQATAVTEVDSPNEDVRRFTATIHDGYDIVGNTNGGYLLAIAGRAMAAATGRPDPISVTGHYLSPGRAGDVTIDVTVRKQGRQFATASAVLTSAEGRPVVTTLGSFGEVRPSGDDVLLTDGEPPALASPDDSVLIVAGDPLPPQFMDRVELRIIPDDAVFFGGKKSGQPRVRGWFRLRNDEPITTNALLCAVDAFPPTIFNVDMPVGWVPTLELTAHVRAKPAPGWLACTFRTRFIAGGALEVDGEIWDTAGNLVAQSRQLALVPAAAK